MRSCVGVVWCGVLLYFMRRFGGEVVDAYVFYACRSVPTKYKHLQ